MTRWAIRYGRWWMVQVALDGTVSLGIHIDPLRRRAIDATYGPYLDMHVGPVVLSIGNRPAWAGELHNVKSSVSIMRPEARL